MSSKNTNSIITIFKENSNKKDLKYCCCFVTDILQNKTRKFAEEYPNFEFVQQVVAQIPYLVIVFLVIFCRTILLAKTVKACIIKLLYSNKVYYQINLVH